ncbi:MAG: HAMP domain-containing protein [Acidiferrobacterales bacterium]|nr:HAMP domain-containing protein [Acidiferrobacterales bacterium]
MRPLFFRILAVLLSSFVAVLIVAFFLFRWTGPDRETERESIQALAIVTSGHLVDAYLEGQPRPVLRKLKGRFHARAWILDENNQLLLGKPLPKRISSAVTSYPSFAPVGSDSKRQRFVIGNEIQRNNTVYRVIFDFPGSGFRHGPISIPFTGRIVLLLFSLVLASVFLSYWVLRPVKVFVKTTQQFSSEHLNARIDHTITRRKDAFGNLGREFNQMADRLSRSLKSQQQLLRDVSHELRSPLARIQVAASLLNQKLGDKTELSRIEMEVERLDDLIERLLSLSRLQNTQQLDKSPVNLGTLLAQLIEDANYEFAQESKSASFIATVKDVTIKCDQKLVSSALENILRNALRFNEIDQPVVVGLEKRQVNTIPGALITIKDSGPGVDPSHLPQLFEPFYQVDSARHIDTGHHGIGLALAHTIVSLHHGKLVAENNSDRGLIVKMWLPVS